MLNLSKTLKRYNHWKVLFFGSDRFSLPVLELLTQKYEGFHKEIGRLDVVTTLDKNKSTKDRHPILEHTYREKLGHLTPITTDTKEGRQKEWEEFHNDLQEAYKYEKDFYDIGIICSYGYMIDSKIIDLFSKGIFVIHPSLLPIYRGATPMQQALLNNDEQTGVTICQASKNEFDAGKVWLQKKHQIDPDDTYIDLSKKLSKLSVDLVDHFLKNYKELSENNIVQNNEEKSAAPLFTKECNKII